jgi:uncharacterized membrane protein YjgN (DUF898 family)
MEGLVYILAVFLSIFIPALIAFLVGIPVGLVVFYFAQKSGGFERTESTIKSALGAKELKAEGSDLNVTWWEYFVKILLWFLMSWFSLGIAKPFADVWFWKWRFGNTKINGRKLVFSGAGGEFWVKCLIWHLLGMATFGVYWVLYRPVRVQQYIASNLHFEGRPGKTAPSEFTGGIWDYFLIRVATFAMAVSVLGIPAAISMNLSYVYNHYVIDGNQLGFTGRWNVVLAMQVYWMTLTIISFGIWAITALPFEQARFITQHMNIDTPAAEVVKKQPAKIPDSEVEVIAPQN